MDSRFKTAFYPAIVDIKSAQYAVDNAAVWASFVAAVTGTAGIYALFYGPIWGLDSFALADAALMVIVAWRIRQFSKAWAIVGLCYWIVNLVYRLITTISGAPVVGAISIFVLLGFVNGVRGAFGVDKFTKKPSNTPRRERVGECDRCGAEITVDNPGWSCPSCRTALSKELEDKLVEAKRANGR